MLKMLKKYAPKPVFCVIYKLVLSIVLRYKSLKIVRHFSAHFRLLIASKDLISNVYDIRYQVYCEELAFEPLKASHQEIDEFDSYSKHCLVQLKRSGDCAGTVRVVSPKQENELLPIEKYCSFALENSEIKPSDYKRTEVCEISRLAIPVQFRRRRDDKFRGVETGFIVHPIYTKNEMRCFPFLAISLYLAAASLAILTNHKHAFVMMEPRLARSMALVGVKFKQLGPVVEYHGKRAPYYINAEMLNKSLPAGFKCLFKFIDAAFIKQLHK